MHSDQLKRWRIAAVALLLSGAGAASGGEVPAALAGPAFSDQRATAQMSPAWREQGLRYADWAGEADLAVSLDQHLYAALLPLIKRYAREHHLDIALQEGTCGISAGALEDKQVDVGGFCCPAGRSDRLPGLRFHTLGIAALALIVNPANPVGDISLGQAREIFRGRISDWGALPGGRRGRPVQAVARLHCKARPGHWRLLLDNEDLFGPRVEEVSTIPDMLAAVAIGPDVIGYETLWMAERGADRGKVKLLRLGGVAASDRAALAGGRYPLYRVYNLTTWETPNTRNPKAAALVQYLLQQVGRIDRRYGLVPAPVLRAQGWRFHGDELVGTPRIATTTEVSG